MASGDPLIRDIAKLFVKYGLDEWRIVIDLVRRAGPEYSDIAMAIEEIASKHHRVSDLTGKKPITRTNAMPNEVDQSRVVLLTKVRDELLTKTREWRLTDIRDVYLQSGGKQQLPQGKRDAVVRALIMHLARLPDEVFASAVKTILERGVGATDLQADYGRWFKMIYGAPEQWTIEIIKLPLPSSPIGDENSKAGTKLSPSQSFSTLGNAAASARKLVQEGYGLRMTGPDGQDWSHEQIVGYINGLAMK